IERAGFTIVELLIVIVVIAILAAISLVAYNGIQERARNTKINQDLASLQKAIMLARETTGKTLYGITTANFTGNACASKDTGADLAALPKTDGCWVRYETTLKAIYDASGSDVRNIVDPWGRPYAIDENEGENYCAKDTISVFTTPFTGKSYQKNEAIPLSGYSGCSTM
ncbi:MAG: type II secretion system protein, partial [Candidatus Saccharimonas sp.]